MDNSTIFRSNHIVPIIPAKGISINIDTLKLLIGFGIISTDLPLFPS